MTNVKAVDSLNLLSTSTHFLLLLVVRYLGKILPLPIVLLTGKNTIQGEAVIKVEG
ncbi:MAG: hypothetical protein AAF915_18575 [Cyanobacteria bacterium P01_D01_bin.50]